MARGSRRARSYTRDARGRFASTGTTGRKPKPARTTFRQRQAVSLARQRRQTGRLGSATREAKARLKASRQKLGANASPQQKAAVTRAARMAAALAGQRRIKAGPQAGVLRGAMARGVKKAKGARVRPGAATASPATTGRSKAQAGIEQAKRTRKFLNRFAASQDLSAGAASLYRKRTSTARQSNLLGGVDTVRRTRFSYAGSAEYQGRWRGKVDNPRLRLNRDAGALPQSPRGKRIAADQKAAADRRLARAKGITARRDRLERSAPKPAISSRRAGKSINSRTTQSRAIAQLRKPSKPADRTRPALSTGTSRKRVKGGEGAAKAQPAASAAGPRNSKLLPGARFLVNKYGLKDSEANWLIRNPKTAKRIIDTTESKRGNAAASAASPISRGILLKELRKAQKARPNDPGVRVMLDKATRRKVKGPKMAGTIAKPKGLKPGALAERRGEKVRVTAATPARPRKKKAMRSVTTPERQIVADQLRILRKKLKQDQKDSEKAMARRASLGIGASRARVTTANARWARRAEERDKTIERIDALRERGRKLPRRR